MAGGQNGGSRAASVEARSASAAEVDDHDHEDEVVIPEDLAHSKFSWKKFWAFTGPGWIMSIA